MQNKRKIINDPVFGFISIPNEMLFDIVEHRFFQRLSRIKQLGLASYVYPGAQHTRFQHSIGALFLTMEAIEHLRLKGHTITQDEANGVMAAILMHDIGHGPFSHVLEHTLVADVSHEEISLMMMEQINREMEGKLSLAISIFRDEYEKKFLHQLISSQLDMDRLDYLRRDCFYTGVVEGEIGSARIIKMLDVENDSLVVESKGIYSIENFLIARRFMYWQVYLHKTSLAAEEMLIRILQRAIYLCTQGEDVFATPALKYFLSNRCTRKDFEVSSQTLEHFVNLDDSDILSAIKVWSFHGDSILSNLSRGFISRKLMKVMPLETPLTPEQTHNIQQILSDAYCISPEDTKYYYAQRTVQQRTYDSKDGNIGILINGKVRDITEVGESVNPQILSHNTIKHFLCYLPNTNLKQLQL